MCTRTHTQTCSCVYTCKHKHRHSNTNTQTHPSEYTNLLRLGANIGRWSWKQRVWTRRSILMVVGSNPVKWLITLWCNKALNDRSFYQLLCFCDIMLDDFSHTEISLVECITVKHHIMLLLAKIVLHQAALLLLVRIDKLLVAVTCRILPD